MTNRGALAERRERISELGGRTDYERDYTAILYSHAFRRLKHKTQVFFFPVNDHICTRLDHSLYVSAISSVVCRNLTDRGVECDSALAGAIAIGHDLGHPPFGHAGERRLNELAEPLGGFKHELHSLRIIDKLEKPRPTGPVVGLNLTLGVRDGIAHHAGESRSNVLVPSQMPGLNDVGDDDRPPCTLEGCIVRLVDKISYLGRDVEDAITAGVIEENSLPARIRARIGSRNGEIVEYFVKDIIASSTGEEVRLSDDASAVMDEMLNFNYKYIYEAAKFKSLVPRVGQMLDLLFGKLVEIVSEYKDSIISYRQSQDDPVQVLGSFLDARRNLYFSEEKFDRPDLLYRRIIIDFVSTLTDRFAFDAFSALFLPKPLI